MGECRVGEGLLKNPSFSGSAIRGGEGEKESSDNLSIIPREYLVRKGGLVRKEVGRC